MQPTQLPNGSLPHDGFESGGVKRKAASALPDYGAGDADGVKRPRTGKHRSKTPPAPDQEDESEDACMVCGGVGELLVCDFPSCGKVFHRTCIWPGSANADSSASKWLCPRHRCCVCGEVESEQNSTVSLRKCSQCTISCCSKHTPPGEQGCTGDYLCPYCRDPSASARLGRILQEAWAKMATHYLALPFMRPLLSEEAAMDATSEGGHAKDLIGILEKIRRMEYRSSSAFQRDMEHIYQVCLARDSAPILAESWRTLMINAEQVLARHQSTLQLLNSGLAASPGVDGVLASFGARVGLQGFHPGTSMPHLTPCRSIKEWEQYCSEAPVQVLATNPVAILRRCLYQRHVRTWPSNHL